MKRLLGLSHYLLKRRSDHRRARAALREAEEIGEFNAIVQAHQVLHYVRLGFPLERALQLAQNR